ncbi:preprotein translocase subunit SecA [Yoonia litorea]|uniref:Protein translocase subunit SecA n=1 Tax=Yoonia litorea TaxID=1123755 RepID=A0A1I6N3H0_9RHOB|nr:preprotein translocase subunit SecA [Yoonia litorea]SFS22525.1 protein translocase subunit secA [Yoonia litorea]
MSRGQLARPGLISGYYPERADERITPLDRFFVGLTAQLETWAPDMPLTDRAFAARVNLAGKRLKDTSDLSLRQMAGDISAKLKTKGLNDQRSAQAFALIRELAGRELGMRHFDVQLIGGRTILNGKIAEMDTGEGKTLTATLPAATMAMAGVPVHVVTVNDFLAARDADWMRPLYNALGLSVGVILEGMDPEERRAAYACDITYCTNKQLAFDYLKDRLILEQETRPMHMAIDGLVHAHPRSARVMMRGLCYAIVDEADSVLVDEARTPLIITQPGDVSEMEQTFIRAIEVARSMSGPRDFTIDEANWRIHLTDLGKAQIARVSSRWGGVWATDTHREELTTQALSALYLYHKDKHYIVQDERVQIVDEYTGRVMSDRSWERGLHQMIELKEGVELTGRQETLIRISYQRFFRRYMRLSGMTGTAQEIAAELRAVYRLKTRRVPNHKRSKRKHLGQRTYATADQKWSAVMRVIAKESGKGRPVLVGTRSVAASEELAGRLVEAGISHRVLNARQDGDEAEIVAAAGQPGAVTVATNMAGRGTDITLAPSVRDKGGLMVIMTEMHDSARIDRQLFGRCARQGDPGTTLAITAMDDDLMRLFYGDKLNWMTTVFSFGRGRMPGWIVHPLMRLAQKATERKHSATRRNLLRTDDALEDLLAFSGRTE